MTFKRYNRIERHIDLVDFSKSKDLVRVRVT